MTTMPKTWNHRCVFHALDFSKYESNTEKLKEREEIEKPKRMTTPTTFMKLDPGEYVVRLLPSAATEEPFAGMPYMRLWQHWNVGPNNDRVLCPEKMAEDRHERDHCYICEQVSALYATGAKPDEKLANQIRAKQSFIYQVIDRDDPVWTAADEGVDERPELIGTPKIKLMRLPWSAHSQILDYYTDAEYGDLSHPLTGLDVIVKRSGTGIDTQYGIKTKRTSTPMFVDVAGDPDEKTMAAALENMQVLNEHPWFQPNTYDETLAIWSGLDSKDIPKDRSMTPGATTPTAKALPAPAAQLSDLAKWVRDVNTPQDGIAPPRGMTRQELAEWGGWDETDLATCYADEPDHKSQYCQECPLSKPCAVSYFKKTGKYSINAPDPQVAATPTGKPPAGKPTAPVGKPPAPVESAEGSSVAQLSSFLKSSGAEDPT